jgi:HlyD family secretion protein
VRVSSDSNAQIQLVGNVQEISPLVNNETRQATVKVSLPSSDQLRPGLFLKAAITAESNQGITVPAKAVLPQPDGSSLVYVLADGKAQAKPVQVGAIQTDAASRDSANSESSSDRIAIKSGLALGDRVIVSGAGYLKDGQSVTVASEEPSSTSATSTKPNSFTAPSNPSSASSGTSDNNRRSATTP